MFKTAFFNQKNEEKGGTTCGENNLINCESRELICVGNFNNYTSNSTGSPAKNFENRTNIAFSIAEAANFEATEVTFLSSGKI